jgi:hypothetical protein
MWKPAFIGGHTDRTGMRAFDEGLRCQDVHSGLRNVDPNSPALVPLADTRVVGMAATVAGLIRGRDVIPDAQALATVAAHQLDVDHLAFSEVVGVLEEVGFVEGVQREGRRVVAFTESVPYYDDLYQRLGEAWEDRQPTDVERQMVSLVDGLSTAPLPVEELAARLDLDDGDLPGLLRVGTEASLVQVVRSIDGDLAYSPFFGFENPELFSELVEQHGSGRLAEEFAAVRREQGLAVSLDRYPLLADAVGRGMVMAPSVQVPSGGLQPFAAIPYITDQTILKSRKPVLDKALAVLACLRCAQRFGGYSNLSASGLIDVIDKLLDRNRGFILPHSSHARQYELMRNAGLIRFGPDTRPGGSWVTPIFIDTEDNREALALARDLLVHGEAVQHRVDDSVAQGALALGKGYTAPMQTMHRGRDMLVQDSKELSKLIESALGLGEL